MSVDKMPWGGTLQVLIGNFKNKKMEPNFNPEEFKQTGDGYVKKEAIENKEKAERMAHVEHSIRSKMDEAVEIAMAEIKMKTIDGMTKKAVAAGELEGERYDKEKLVEEFKNIEDLQAVRLPSPLCCESGTGGPKDRLQDYIYVLIGKGEVKSRTFIMRNCNSGYSFVKDGKLTITTKIGAEYFDRLLPELPKSSS